jgi:hypothetical protein
MPGRDTNEAATRPDPALSLSAAARERARAAAADLLLPSEHRLSDWQRATLTALLGKLIRTIEDELRAALAEHPAFSSDEALHAALTSAHLPIAQPILERSSLLREPALVSLLLRRAEEHRLSRARQISPAAGDGALAALVADPDEAVSGAAMAVLVAQSRRLDRFDEPALARTELPAELQHRLVWAVAAALRLYLVGRHSAEPGVADAALGEATTRFLGAYDESEALEAHCARLASRLLQLGRLDDSLVARLLSDGSLPLFLAGLAGRSGLSLDSVWELVSDSEGEGAVLMLRGSGLGRSAAAEILVALRPDDADRLLGRFDLLAQPDAADALRLWRIDPAYREALAALSGPNP